MLRALIHRTLNPTNLGPRGLGHLLARSFATTGRLGSGYLDRIHHDQQPLVQGEPPKPEIITSTAPGPKTKAGLEHLNRLQDTRAAFIMTDLDKSVGNFVADLDGNIASGDWFGSIWNDIYLDVFCQIASLPLGYNSKALIDAASSPEMIQMLVNRPALGVQPPGTWGTALEQSLMSVAPKGLTQVFTAMCGTCSNETAYKVC
ncbi:hypothetical protein BGX31_009400 [Mortierella sp. GBA43]|nr:hypothetical protein BGX31_009400 [Mortierella sp. GBA43]